MNIFLITDYIISYFKTKLINIFPYSNLILINKSTLKIYRLNILFLLFYYFIYFISTALGVTISLFLKKNFNYFLSNYIVSYSYNNKYYLSEKFIIKKNKELDVKCTDIQKVILCYNNKKCDITNIIKKYDNNYLIIYFFLINNINPKEIKNIKLEYIPIFNINSKELPLNNFMNKKIGYILKI